MMHGRILAVYRACVHVYTIKRVNVVRAYVRARTCTTILCAPRVHPTVGISLEARGNGREGEHGGQ